VIYALNTNIISYLLRRSYNHEVAKRFESEIEQGNHYVISSPKGIYGKGDISCLLQLKPI